MRSMERQLLTIDAVQESSFKTEFDYRDRYKGIGRGVQERRCDKTINHRDERFHEGIEATCCQSFHSVVSQVKLQEQDRVKFA